MGDYGFTSSGSDNSNRSKRFAFHCCMTERRASRSATRFSVVVIVRSRQSLEIDKRKKNEYPRNEKKTEMFFNQTGIDLNEFKCMNNFSSTSCIGFVD